LSARTGRTYIRKGQYLQSAGKMLMQKDSVHCVSCSEWLSWRNNGYSPSRCPHCAAPISMTEATFDWIAKTFFWWIK